MKNQDIKGICLRNYVKILGICILAFFPLRVNAQSKTLDQTVLDFYQKYMIACRQFSQCPTEKDEDAFFCGMDIKKYITKSLFEKIVRSRKAEPSGDLLSPSDPNYLGDGDYFYTYSGLCCRVGTVDDNQGHA